MLPRPRSVPTLEWRFRRASALLLLPMLMLACTSVFALVRGQALSQSVENVGIGEARRIDDLNRHVLQAGIAGNALLASARVEDLDRFAGESRASDATFRSLLAERGGGGEEFDWLRRAYVAWVVSQPTREAIQTRVTLDSSRDLGHLSLQDNLNAGIDQVTGDLTLVRLANVRAVERERTAHDWSQRLSLAGVALSFLIGIGAALALSRDLARSVLAPLQALRGSALRIGAGDLDERVSTGFGAELAAVGGAFNAMAAALAERDATVQRSERRLSALVQNSSDGVIVMTPDRRVVFETPNAARLFALRERLDSDDHGPLVHPDDRARVARNLDGLIAQGKGAEDEFSARLHATDGRWRDVEVRMINLVDDPAVEGVVATIRDVTERVEMQEMLAHQAGHDPLTGLANRNLLRERIEHALLRSRRDRRQQAVLYLDLDSFKGVNDRLGHTGGDELLLKVAERILNCVRPGDTVARLGGDEYAVLLEATDAVAAATVCRRITESLTRPFSIHRSEVLVSASIGVAIGSHGDADAASMLHDADIAMYVAKRSGPGRFEFFEGSMHSETLDRLQLQEDLRAALDGEGLSLVYQPIVDLRSEEVVAVEALLRWSHPTRGPIGPDRFIPMAEESGLVTRLDTWVLRQAASQARAWQCAGLRPIRIAVNMSGRDLRDPALVDVVARVLAETGLAPNLLELELTESVAAAEGSLRMLERLKSLGVNLAIDDFGTGYSVLGRLRSFPFDRLKIDKSFVSEVAHRDLPAPLLEAMIQMAQSLRLEVVAEGVETREQAAFLRSRGCDDAQGYLFSRPVDAGVVRQLLEGGGSAPLPSVVGAGNRGGA